MSTARPGVEDGDEGSGQAPGQPAGSSAESDTDTSRCSRTVRNLDVKGIVAGE